MFPKLDMAYAYQQFLIDDDSKQYLTINTHRGLFIYNRLAFGVSSAPAIFNLSAGDRESSGMRPSHSGVPG